MQLPLYSNDAFSTLSHCLAEKTPPRFFIVTDSRVNRLYGGNIRQTAAAWEKPALLKVLPPGEKTKNLTAAEKIFQWLHKEGATRETPVIALGGGVIGDLTGFCASIYMRGIPWIFIPTTLLSQADASVGGKTAVNHLGVKNLLGSFYAPETAIIDTGFLRTLPPRQYRSGLAEMIKTAFLDSWSHVEEMERCLLGETLLEPLLRRSAAFKEAAVRQDFRDLSRRNILNLGHTVGHALEAAADNLLHGEAVALGLVAELELSRRQGLLKSGVAEKMERLLTLAQLRTSASFEPSAILELIKSDKKKGFPLLEEPGKIRLNCRPEKNEILEALEKIRKETPQQTFLDSGAPDKPKIKIPARKKGIGPLPGESVNNATTTE